MEIAPGKREETKRKILKILEVEERPVLIEHVANKLRIHWHTAQVACLELSLEGKIKAIQTTRGYLFSRVNFEV